MHHAYHLVLVFKILNPPPQTKKRDMIFTFQWISQKEPLNSVKSINLSKKRKEKSKATPWWNLTSNPPFHLQKSNREKKMAKLSSFSLSLLLTRMPRFLPTQMFKIYAQIFAPKALLFHMAIEPKQKKRRKETGSKLLPGLLWWCKESFLGTKEWLLCSWFKNREWVEHTNDRRKSLLC